MDTTNTVLYANFNRIGDFYTLLGRAVWGPDRPAPTNLDGLADLLRESHVGRVDVHGSWTVDARNTERLEEVFDDLGVELVLPR
ncbi:hypothetical protein [Corynebacterium pacaense]|uniref:hypothetical protein n=1 Tax=Corynebacterium pacaense TaxID=1816684 RepID=UPI0009BB1CEF|nr:hypothetical protein [Corynebacterium pacaense]